MGGEMGMSRSGQMQKNGNIKMDLIYYLVTTVGSMLMLSWAMKKLDPNRSNSKQAAAKKKEIQRRLGRAIDTNVYEDVIACDVVNPDNLTVTLDEVGGLDEIKEAVEELVILPLKRPELFSRGSLLRPVKGVLLYGPPGTGKTMMAKAIAKECDACFINIRLSTIQSKWFGDANKLVTAIFTLAWKLQPSIIFIDEIDSFLGKRRSQEHEAVTNMKTEFMTLWDGFTTDEYAQVMVLAATNRPWEVDDAILRRLPRAFEVGLPAKKEREQILRVILKGESVESGFCGTAPTSGVARVASLTDGYSGSDLHDLCKQAAYRPVRELLLEERRREATGEAPNPAAQARPLRITDFEHALSASSTSNEAAWKYARQDSTRRSARGESFSEDGAASGPGGEIDIGSLMASMAQVMAMGGMGAAGRAAGAGAGAGAGGAEASPGSGNGHSGRPAGGGAGAGGGRKGGVDSLDGDESSTSSNQ